MASRVPAEAEASAGAARFPDAVPKSMRLPGVLNVKLPPSDAAAKEAVEATVKFVTVRFVNVDAVEPVTTRLFGIEITPAALMESLATFVV